MFRISQFALVLAGMVLLTGMPVRAQDRADRPTPPSPAMLPINYGPTQDLGPMATMQMMWMMSHCSMMDGNDDRHHHGGTVTPGNEKLQRQIQAETTQKTGEIVAR